MAQRDRPDFGTSSDHKTPGKPVWDSDRGAYLGRPAVFCTSHLKWHYRVHAPGPKDGGDDRMYNPLWGYYVIASTTDAAVTNRLVDEYAALVRSVVAEAAPQAEAVVET